MLETILERFYGNSSKNNRSLTMEFELLPNLSDVYGVKYIYPELEELVLQHQDQPSTLTCIPWEKPISMNEFAQNLERPIVVLTGKRGNFRHDNSYLTSQFCTKKPICIYQPTTTHYYFLLSSEEDIKKVLRALGLP